MPSRLLLLGALLSVVPTACTDGGEATRPCNSDTDCLDVERCALGVCSPRPSGDGDGDGDGDDGPEVPAAWTCDALTYDEGGRGIAAVTCECGCGAPDPDCDDADALPTGCLLTDGFVCIAGACVDQRCGNGVLDESEGCDDVNIESGDGCAQCVIEAGFACAGEPSLCTLLCGNGALDDGETCDDENIAGGDGCAEACSIEDGFTCDGTPSRCAPTCGDDSIVGDEVCDGTAAAVTCADVGPFIAGDITCSAECTVDDQGSCAPPVVCGGGDAGSVLGLVTSGTTDGALDDWQVPPTAGCGAFPPGAEDTSISWTAPESATYVFSTTGSDFDTVLLLLAGCSAAVLGCHDDVSAQDKTSRVEVSLDAGTVVLVVIDGWNPSAAGPYALHVETVVE